MAEWRPLITDPAKREALVAVIREISDAVPVPAATELPLHVDRAVTRAYLAQDDVVPDPDDAVGTALSEAVTSFASSANVPSLFGGACGLGWVVEHLAGGETAEQVCAAIDRALLARTVAWTGDYDLIIGLVGFGVYSLERGPAGHAVTGRVLDTLERTAVPLQGGVAWHTHPDLLADFQRATAPEGYWNLGLAHGIAGVIGFLTRCVRHDVFATRARSLLEQAMTFLLAVSPPREGSRFAAWLPTHLPLQHDGTGRRVAWCYGDLGVSLSIFAAAAACGRDDWREQALLTARACASFDDPSVRDAGLCHGTAGAAHLFGRLWNATGEQVFADAARGWIDRTLAIRRPAADYAGFPALEVQTWVPSASLLTGAPGVALALHAAMSEIEPSWDRVLLVDL